MLFLYLLIKPNSFLLSFVNWVDCFDFKYWTSLPFWTNIYLVEGSCCLWYMSGICLMVYGVDFCICIYKVRFTPCADSVPSLLPPPLPFLLPFLGVGSLLALWNEFGNVPRFSSWREAGWHTVISPIDRWQRWLWLMNMFGPGSVVRTIWSTNSFSSVDKGLSSCLLYSWVRW